MNPPRFRMIGSDGSSQPAPLAVDADRDLGGLVMTLPAAAVAGPYDVTVTLQLMGRREYRRRVLAGRAEGRPVDLGPFVLVVRAVTRPAARTGS